MAADNPWVMCPTLGVQDVRAAVDFFDKRLGFEVRDVLHVSADEGAVYAIVQRNGAEIHLQIRRRTIWAAPREDIERDVYVRVPDVDGLYAEFVQRGTEILRAPMDEPYGMRDFIVSGPEGYRLDFGSPIQPDAAA